MKNITGLNVKIFADGADKAGMLEMYKKPYIMGFTTNPTLMRKAGISDYKAFAMDIVQAIPDRPISFEVLSDDFDDMEQQAHKIAGWGENVYVKIPVTNTMGNSSADLVGRLSKSGVKVNATAITTIPQVIGMINVLCDGPAACVSIFAGRIADTGRDPIPVMAEAVKICSPYKNIELIWASPREVLNVFQADAVHCHIITATDDILKKLNLAGKDLDEFSLDTVKMFRNDAVSAGFTL